MLIYGTAWKGGATQELVTKALQAGYRSFDTAAQPKHYREELVGAAIREFLVTDRAVQREDLFLQTKYCPPAGQDPTRIPYDPSSSVATQVETSIQSSLTNLRLGQSEQTADETYIDCLILHSPLETLPLTLEAWRSLEQFVPHKVRALGISNVSLPILASLHESAVIKPSVVQNRFYSASKFDVPLREFCKTNNILYEAFWTLTANPLLLRSPPVTAIASAVSIPGEVALYGLIIGLGNIAVLNGTTNESRITGDLEGLANMEQWRAEDKNKATWHMALENFRRLIKDDK